MKTEEEFQKALAEGGDNAQLHFEYANFLRDEGRFQDAEHEFERAVALDECHAKANLELTRLYLEPGFFRPQYATIHILKAYELLDEFEDGGEAFYDILEEHVRILEEMYLNEELAGEHRALAAVLLGRMNLQMDIRDDAAKWFYAFMELKDDLPDAEKEAVEGLRQIEESVDATLEDKSIDNDVRAQALFTRGIMKYHEGDHDGTWTLVKAARNFAPPDTEVYLKATIYYIQLVMEKGDRTQEETQEALELCDELLGYDLDDELKEIINSFKAELG